MRALRKRSAARSATIFKRVLWSTVSRSMRAPLGLSANRPSAAQTRLRSHSLTHRSEMIRDATRTHVEWARVGLAARAGIKHPLATTGASRGISVCYFRTCQCHTAVRRPMPLTLAFMMWRSPRALVFASANYRLGDVRKQATSGR